VYNIPRVYRLLHGSNKSALINSIKDIINRHDVLRTYIKTDNDGRAYQFLNAHLSSLEVTNYKVNSQLELDLSISKEVNHIYRLDKEYPIKICLYDLLDENGAILESYISIVIHHIAADGWSLDIFSRELNYYYNLHHVGAHANNSSSLDTLNVQYSDFSIWQRNYLSGDRLEKQINYWKSKLNGYEVLLLPLDKARPSKVDYNGDNICFELDEITSSNLRKLAKNLDVSLYSVLLGTFYLLLKNYSNQDDIIVGTIVANRHYQQIDNLIGFFANTVVLRKKC